jgi:putative hydrolase of the HAD superfamily
MDVGGVLVVPRPANLSGVVAAYGGTSDPRTLIRAHYQAMHDADSDESFDWPVYHDALLRHCGVRAEDRETCAEDMAEAVRVTADWWSHPVDGVADALPLLAERYRLGIVSNSDGTVRRLLAQLGLCQVGSGPATPVEVIVDSAEVGVEKPDPRIFAAALEPLDLQPGEVGYVGDTRAFDMAGARAAGLVPLHLDPYRMCPDSGHRHIAGIADLAA